MKRFISGDYISEEFEKKQPKSQWAGFPQNISGVWVCLARTLQMPSTLCAASHTQNSGSKYFRHPACWKGNTNLQ